MLENMKMEQLEYFGIPHYIIKTWKEHYSDFLLPVQEKAVRQFNLLCSSHPNFPSNLYSNLYEATAQSREKPENLLVISPSSSGKTLVGEMAALQEISFHNKVIYLVPLRILAEEKYQHFVHLYHSLGLKIKLSSRDHRHDDQDIRQGNFHIAILVYEKFYYFLLQYPQCLHNVSLIVADEIQLINDPQRGPRLESNFNYLKANYPAIRIIALSALTEHILALTTWLDAKLLWSSYRPVELRKGIVREGIYHYLEHNSKITGKEFFFPPEDVQECNLASYLKATLQFLIEQQESNLIFFSTKKEVRLWSSWLASQFTLNPAQKAMEQMQIIEDSTSKEELINLLQKGIAYHCADLSWPERHIIEEAVRIGELKIVCATGTLAMGVNLPVNNVILTGQKIVSGQKSDRYNRYDRYMTNYYQSMLTFSEVENMGGRAGRLNPACSFGRIIFLAPSLIELTAYQKLYFPDCSKDGETWLPCYFYPALQLQQEKQKESQIRHYVKDVPILENTLNEDQTSTPYAKKDIVPLTNVTTISPALREISKERPIIVQKDILTFLLYRIALDCDSFQDICQLLKTGNDTKKQTFWRHQFSQTYSESELLAYLKQLESEQLITIQEEKYCQLTEMGRLVTSKGISFPTYLHFLKWIKESQKENSSELEILFLIATSSDGEEFFTDYPGRGSRVIKNKKSLTHKWKEFLRLRMLNLIFEQQEEDKLIFQNNLNINNINSNSPQLKEAQSKNELKKYLALKNTLLMHDWITARELKEIEQDYGLLGGAIQKMGEGFSWLADALAALAIGVGWREDRAGDLEKIEQLSARLIAGVEPAGLPLAKLHIPGLSRGYIQRLVQEGYQDEQCLRELSEKQLQPLLPALLIKKIKEWLNSGSYSKSNKNNINSNKNNKIIRNKIDKNKINSSNPVSDYEHNQKPEAQSNKNCPPPTKSEIKNEIRAIITINSNRPDQILFLGEEIAVNKIGYQLILFLAQNKGKVISYEQLIDTLWPDDEDATYHRLWYHLGKLRNSMQKIMQEQHQNNNNLGLPDLPDNYLKEKLFRVIPGRGLILEETVSVEIPTVRGDSPETP
jgi:helicase